MIRRALIPALAALFLLAPPARAEIEAFLVSATCDYYARMSQTFAAMSRGGYSLEEVLVLRHQDPDILRPDALAHAGTDHYLDRVRLQHLSDAEWDRFRDELLASETERCLRDPARFLPEVDPDYVYAGGEG